MENPSEQVLTDDYEHVEENVLYTPVNVQGRGVDARAFEEQLKVVSAIYRAGSIVSVW